MELAEKLRRGINLPEGVPTSLDVQHVSDGPGASTFPNGCHVCEVEVDPETGVIEVVKYSSVNDFGTVINPMIVEGQLHGGVVQGIGQALMEMTVYDADGQLLTGSYMDYAMPRASDAPSFSIANHPVPATTNPLGVKGCGEAGCAGSLTSMMNAVVDALSEYGIRHIDMPATPTASGRRSAPRTAHGRRDSKTLQEQLAGHDPGHRASASDRARAARTGSSAASASRISSATIYIMLLAPLFLFVREDYGVSYTELGLALTAFNVRLDRAADADRLPGRPRERAHGADRGPAARRRRHSRSRGSCNSFWVFVAMFAVAGLANTVYHPADYALLSQHVPPERAGRVFSFHTFAGMLGNAAAPPTLLFLQSLVGWRGAFLGAAVLGVVAAVVLLLTREPEAPQPPPRRARTETTDAPLDGWRLLTVAADPAQSRVLHPAVVLRRRAQQLSRGRARRALRHAG